MSIQDEKLDQLEYILDEMRDEYDRYPMVDSDYDEVPMSERPDNWDESLPSSPSDSFLSFGEKDEEGNDIKKSK